MSGTVTAPQAVSFSTIPPNLRVPLFWAEVNNSQAGANQQNQRVLIVGATLNAVPLAPVFMPPPSGTGALGAAQAAAALFGKGSMLAQMVGAYRSNDPFTELWVLPVADPAGTAATGQLVISGTATANGTLSIYIGGLLLAVPVISGQTAAQVATAVVAAVTAASFPVTASASTGTVTLTTRHLIAEMNSLSLMLNYLGSLGGEATPAGITVSVTTFASATGAPVLTGMSAALGIMDFDFIVSGYNDAGALTALSAMMADAGGRWSYLNQLYGGVFVADVDTFTNLLTFGAAKNDQHLVVWGANGTPTPPWKVAAFATAAVVPSICAQPNLPLQQLQVGGVLAPPVASVSLLPSVSTEQSMLTTGIALLSWDRANVCRVVRCVTTYQTNSFGSPDQSYLDVGTLYTLMLVLRTLKGMVTQRYANVLLVMDGTPIGAGIAAVSPRTIKADLIAQYTIMEDLGLVQNSAAFIAGLIVTINIQDPTRVDVLFDPYLVSGLAIFAVATQFHLNAGANSNLIAAAA